MALQNKHIGKFFTLNCGVVVKVDRYITSRIVVVEDSLGNSREASLECLCAGTVSWSSFGVPDKYKGVYQVLVGDIFILKCGTPVKVSSYYNVDKIIIEDNLGRKRQTSKGILIRGSMIWNATENDKKVKSKLSYVYTVEHQGEIVYIGMGSGTRVDHTNSGRSSVIGLNQLYCEGEEVKTTIIKDCLDNKEALRIEKEMILRIKPKFNIVNNSKNIYGDDSRQYQMFFDFMMVV